MLDGQIRELDEPFEVDGKKADRPGAFDRPEEDINFRCAMLTRARWRLGKGFTKYEGFTGTTRSFNSELDYQEFKKSFFSEDNMKYMKYTASLEEKYGTKNYEKLLASMSDKEYAEFHDLESKSPLLNNLNSYSYIDIISETDIINLPDILIGRSVGAKFKNYDIELPNLELVHLSEGSRITNVTVIAGKGKN